MGETALYTIYGLTLESEVEIPEALPARKAAAPHARVAVGSVSPYGLDGDWGHPLGPFAQASCAAVWFHVPGVARFLVTGGEQVLIDPHPGIDQGSIRLFLLGSALGALCFQRGLTVLHGSAVVIGDGCLVCAGPPGSGKSTLAAEFMRRGYPVLADDMVPFNGECNALPGVPQLRLLPDAAQRLAVQTGELRPIRPHDQKLQYPLGMAFKREPVPIRWIYVLSREPGSFRIEPISGMDRLGPLRCHTYRFGFLAGMGLQAKHLRACGRLASSSRLSVVHLPADRIGPAEVTDRLLADVGMFR